MEINLHQLDIFLCIARERSFSKAADKMRISQPSVSIQIKNLEDALGVKLFERLSRRVFLTPEGTAVLERAKKISEVVSELQGDITWKIFSGLQQSAERDPRATSRSAI